jgi:hypothetical protein
MPAIPAQEAKAGASQVQNKPGYIDRSCLKKRRKKDTFTLFNVLLDS